MRLETIERTVRHQMSNSISYEKALRRLKNEQREMDAEYEGVLERNNHMYILLDELSCEKNQWKMSTLIIGFTFFFYLMYEGVMVSW
jgi:hypothetical protein